MVSRWPWRAALLPSIIHKPLARVPLWFSVISARMFTQLLQGGRAPRGTLFLAGCVFPVSSHVNSTLEALDSPHTRWEPSSAPSCSRFSANMGRWPNWNRTEHETPVNRLHVTPPICSPAYLTQSCLTPSRVFISFYLWLPPGITRSVLWFPDSLISGHLQRHRSIDNQGWIVTAPVKPL